MGLLKGDSVGVAKKKKKANAVICLQPSEGFSFPLIFLLTLHMQCPQTFQKNDHFFSALWQPVTRPAARGDIQSQQVLSCGAERAAEHRI